MNIGVNPENQQFIRYSIYDQGHLVFCSLNREEAKSDMILRQKLRHNYIRHNCRSSESSEIGYDDLSNFGFVLKREVCNLRGYVIDTHAIDVDSTFHKHDYSYGRYNSNEHDFHMFEYDDGHHSNQAYQAQAFQAQSFQAQSFQAQSYQMNHVYDQKSQDELNYMRQQIQQLKQYQQELQTKLNMSTTLNIQAMPNMQNMQNINIPTHQLPPVKIATPQEQLPEVQNVIQRGARKVIVQDKTPKTLEEQMASLASEMSALIKATDAGKVVEAIYPDLKEEIQMDKEIKEMQNEFLDDVESEKSRELNMYDEMLESTQKISTKQDYFKDIEDKDSDSEDSPDAKDLHRDDEIPETCPEHLKEHYLKLLAAKDALKESIETEEELIAKANENLQHEQFLERCRIQDEKKAKKKYESELSILTANKFSYMKIRSKVLNRILQESNLPMMFADKYVVMRYMEINELIDLTSNGDLNEELKIYNNLYKVIESKEYKRTKEHSSSDTDSDSDSDNIASRKDKGKCDEEEYSIASSDNMDPINQIDEEYADICCDFMEFLEENFPYVVSEGLIHKTLNNGKSEADFIEEVFDQKQNRFEEIVNGKTPRDYSREMEYTE